MTTMFVAELKLRYGEPSLTEVTVIKETPKTYQIERESKDLIGWVNVSTRLYKNKHHVFPTLEEALTWLVSKADKYSSQCLDKFQGACNTQGELEDMLWAERQKGHDNERSA